MTTASLAPKKIINDSRRKCSRSGCSRPRHENYDFCFACLVTGKSRPAARVTCNNLTSLPASHDTP